MESLLPVQQTMGSTVLLTNKTTISNKLLTLASPKPRRAWICRHIKVTVPSIGIIWYLPLTWLMHSYLELTCIREMDLLGPSQLTSVVQVLIALSVVVLVIFTVSAVLKVRQSSEDPSIVGTCLERTSVKHLLQAVRSQMYPLQALAAFILINSYLLLQISQIAHVSFGEAKDNETVAKENKRLETNNSDTALLLLLLPAEKRLTYMMFCGNFAIPLIIYAIQGSEIIWQKEKLWGFLYSFILLLLPLKYLSSSLTFYVISVTDLKFPQILLFQSVSNWLPALYITSALSLFFFSLALKMYIELSFKTLSLSSSTASITLRRKMYSYPPSPFGVTLTSVLVLGCEFPSILHLISFIVHGSSDILIVCLLAFNTAFCLVTVIVSVVVGFRRSCHPKKSRIKKKRADSGVCLANSFVYQTRSEAGKAKC